MLCMLIAFRLMFLSFSVSQHCGHVVVMLELLEVYRCVFGVQSSFASVFIS